MKKNISLFLTCLIFTFLLLGSGYASISALASNKHTIPEKLITKVSSTLCNDFLKIIKIKPKVSSIPSKQEVSLTESSNIGNDSPGHVYDKKDETYIDDVSEEYVYDNEDGADVFDDSLDNYSTDEQGEVHTDLLVYFIPNGGTYPPDVVTGGNR